ncbi:DUF4352 domain-containing protein [Nocardia puris]|uniref:Uncharacterized protein DUF4352 n=1 Tax=Nocardia puris TaxID=208602 RepID=A0A366DQY3_9NOCA|nr:DUF4352 domain-containing protein [Nocardia puris]RBO92492.1 uncharacterized protein DUF4352 [Nocardia puris]
MGYPQMPQQPWPGNQPGWPQPYRQPPPPPKKQILWPWILIAAIVLCGGGCLGIVGIVANNSATDTTATVLPPTTAHDAGNAVPAPQPEDAPQPEPAPEPAPRPAQEPDAAQAGSSVRDGKFEFTVTAVDPPVTVVGDNPYLQTTAQGVYILVHVTVTNIGDRPQTYLSSDQRLIDDQGRRFETDVYAEINLNVYLATPINPGNSVNVTLVFDVPPGTVPAVLQFHDSAFSGGARVALR